MAFAFPSPYDRAFFLVMSPLFSLCQSQGGQERQRHLAAPAQGKKINSNNTYLLAVAQDDPRKRNIVFVCKIRQVCVASDTYDKLGSVLHHPRQSLHQGEEVTAVVKVVVFD